VNHESKTAGDGRSWKRTFQSVQDALTAASKDDEIWVARGTYYPDASDQTKSFVLKEDVASLEASPASKRRGSKETFKGTTSMQAR
jgi:hypothetical protein